MQTSWRGLRRRRGGGGVAEDAPKEKAENGLSQKREVKDVKLIVNG